MRREALFCAALVIHASFLSSRVAVAGTTEGACCFLNGECVPADSEDSCTDFGGIYEGDDTVCDPNPCPVLGGACCFTDGNCALTSIGDCCIFEGIYRGDGSSCEPNTCPGVAGVCCFTDGNCAPTNVGTCCELGGIYLGDGTLEADGSCAPDICPGSNVACCFPDGNCSPSTIGSCRDNGGVYQRDLPLDTSCDPNTCPGSAVGACCFPPGDPNGPCFETYLGPCNELNGTYHGIGTSCSTATCASAPGGACCSMDGTCSENHTETSCTDSGGAYVGDGTDCDPNDCPGSGGACCFSDGTCSELNFGDCETADGVYRGDGTVCDPNTCLGVLGACCLGDGSCSSLSIGDCCDRAGVYQGDGTSCASLTCLGAEGACCLSDTSCSPQSVGDCCEQGGVYHGDGVSCDSVVCVCDGPEDCDDGNFCNGVEQCIPGHDLDSDGDGCIAGPLPRCGDDLPCTTDTCDETDSACIANQDEASCCKHRPLECPDSGNCTVGSCAECNPSVDRFCEPDGHKCVYTPDDTQCDNGLFCDGEETCSLTASCECCIEDVGCTPAPAGSPCPEGLLQCSPGCITGTPPDCADVSGCTVDTCDQTDATCDANQDSVSCCKHTPLDCSDGIECTIDACEECDVKLDPDCEPDGHKCVHTPDDASCQDGDACNGVETCDPTLGCQPGAPIEQPVGCGAGFDPSGRIDTTQKGSLLIFSKVEIKWDAAGNLVQDTFLDFSNDYPAGVSVQAYFINGDIELAETRDGDDEVIQEFEPGWNTADCRFSLTANQPHFWSAANGSDKCQPFDVLDEDGPGRPDPETSGATRILRGYVVMWAVRFNAEGNLWEEIRWNHLKGDAVIVNYENGTAWEYNAWAAQARCGAHGEPLLDCIQFDENGVCCDAEVIPGNLDLDGFQYDVAFDTLLLDFYGTGSTVLSGGGVTASVNTDLTVHAVDADLRQDGCGPVLTKVEAEIWNEFESKFSGTRRCVCCWDQTLLSDWSRSEVIPNHFRRSALRTDKGKARLDGVGSNECDYEELCGPTAFQKMWSCGADFAGGPGAGLSHDAAILGLSTKFIAFSGGITEHATAGMNLVGAGREAATIEADIQTGGEELGSRHPAR